MKALLVAGVAIAFALNPAAAKPLATAGEAPLTGVLLNASPDPSHPNEVVQFSWTATGFPGSPTCNDNRGWIVNGPPSGVLSKRAGVDFNSSFTWIVDCEYGDFFGRGTEDVTYIPNPPPPPPQPPPAPSVQIVSDDPQRTVWANQDGSWTVHKLCLGPSVRGGENTVGPGYISRLVRRDSETSWKEIVQDDQPRGPLNSPKFGGLGAFGFHLARGPVGQTVLNTTNAWALDTRNCAADNGAFGVYASSATQPQIGTDGFGRMHVDVWIRDFWGHTGYGPDANGDGFGDSLMTVSYTYEFRPSVVRAWIAVTQSCPSGCPIGPGTAFVKEPKLASSVTQTDYRRIAIFDHTDQLALWGKDITGDGNADPCAWDYGAPDADHITQTNQCYDPWKVRTRFDKSVDLFGTGGCPDNLCLNVVMQAHRENPFAVGFWKGSTYGFDGWASQADTRPAANSKDQGSCVPGKDCTDPKWGCHGGRPFTDANRTWEMLGGEKNSVDNYLNASVLYNGWAGGFGAYDCEPLSRRFAPGLETYGAYAQYSVGPGWQWP